MSAENVLDIIRKMPGSWRLPIQQDEAITVTFYANGHFTYLISAYSTAKRGVQVLMGPERTGDWHVRSNRTNTSSQTSSVSFRSLLGLEQKSNQVSQGPFLVLNFTDLPKARLNMTAFGFRLELANYINDIFELFRDGNYRIVEFEGDKMLLASPQGDQLWHRTA